MLRRRALPSIALRGNSQYLAFKVEEVVMIMSFAKNRDERWRLTRSSRTTSSTRRQDGGGLMNRIPPLSDGDVQRRSLWIDEAQVLGGDGLRVEQKRFYIHSSRSAVREHYGNSSFCLTKFTFVRILNFVFYVSGEGSYHVHLELFSGNAL